MTLAAEAGMIEAGLADRLRPSAGMRNVLVHAYLDIDPRIVAESIPRAVVAYTEYARQAARRFSTIDG